MTLNDLERQNRGFYGFLTILGCDTRLIHQVAPCFWHWWLRRSW